MLHTEAHLVELRAKREKAHGALMVRCRESQDAMVRGAYAAMDAFDKAIDMVESEEKNDRDG